IAQWVSSRSDPLVDACRVIQAPRPSASPGNGTCSLRRVGLSRIGKRRAAHFTARQRREVIPATVSWAMSIPIPLPTLIGCRFVSPAGRRAVIVIGGLVVAGWGLGIETLKSVVPGMTAMNPGGTAFAFLLAGVALWVHSVSASHRVRNVGKACAGLVVGLA